MKKIILISLLILFKINLMVGQVAYKKIAVSNAALQPNEYNGYRPQSVEKTGGASFTLFQDTVLGNATPFNILVNNNASFTSSTAKRLYTLGDNMSIQKIIKTSDGNYVLAGTIGNKASMIKVNANADTIWTRSYTSAYNFSSVVEDGSGNYVAMGGSTLGGCAVIKISSAGALVWGRSFSSTVNGYGAIALANDGNYVIASTRTNFENDGGLMKINANGTFMFGVQFSDGNMSGYRIDDMVVLANGDIVVAGSEHDMFSGNSTGGVIIRLNSSGILLSNKKLGSGEGYVMSLMPQPNGNIYYVANINGSLGGGYKGVFGKVNSSLSPVWAKVYGSDMMLYHGLKFAGSDNFLITTGNNSGAYVIKVDTNGVSGSCYEKPITVTSTNITLSTTSFTSTGTTISGAGHSLYTNIQESATYTNYNTVFNLNFSNTYPLCDGSCTGSSAVSVSGGQTPYTYLWSTSPFATGTSISNLCPGSYSVNITDAKGCYYSVPVSITPHAPTPDICLITVDSSSINNEIIWDKTLYPTADTFFVYRDTANNNYALIGKVPYTSLSLFKDTVRTLYPANGDPNASSWRYKIAVLDTCGNMGDMSLYHQTIFFQGSAGNFNWSHYGIEGQPTPVSQLNNYLFKRDDNATGVWNTIQSLSASSVAYTDAAYFTYEFTADWRAETNWTISCNPTLRIGNDKKGDEIQTVIVRSKSNIKTNRTVNPNTLSETKNLPSQIKVYPNPANGIINVELVTKNEEAILSLENIFGQKIYSAKMNKGAQSIDVSDFETGVYLVKVKTETGLSVQKIVVE